MKALKLGTLFRIPVYLHWTFSFIIIFIGFTAYRESMDPQQTMAFALYVACVFFCVLLHEYGHALMARKYHIGTQDIILAPIGGIARLKGLPNHPTGELMIAIAGPLVNLVLALFFYFVLKALGVGIILPDTDSLAILTNPIGFIHLLLLLNIILFLFNLIPAYPMDGGRILRAILSYKMNKLKATYIASILGRALAIGFLIFGLYNQIPSLIFIGVFIFVMAGREYNYLKSQQVR